MQISTKCIGIGVVACAVFSPLFAQADIEGSRIKAHVRFLSSDLLEGRGVGSRGGQLAEEYLAATLASFGLKPGGENGTWFQTVPMVGVSTKSSSTLTASRNGQTVALDWQKDFAGATHRQQREVDIDAEAVFVGHGIVSAPEKWSDY
ncbi:MAG: peptidase M28, partial [Bryobacteraceae bacterium]|nr:peptidase M28 [Bryobacteraceae bacterium]